MEHFFSAPVAEEEVEEEDAVPLPVEPLGLGGFLRAISTTILLMSAM